MPKPCAYNLLTAERLRELLDYDPATGVFTRRVNSSNAKAGDLFGSPHGNGYLRGRLQNTNYFLHRLAWLFVTGAWPACQIDHKDGIRANNAFDNLRDVNNSVNAQNTSKPRLKGGSGFLGVSKKRKKWRSRIMLNGKESILGTFETKELAHAAYVQAKRIFHSGSLL